MISHPVSRSRSSIVDQGPVCRARGRTRRINARHFSRVGHRPAAHGFTPCRRHAAALYLCLEGFHRRCCDPRAGFRQAAVGPPDQAPPGQNRAKYHPPRRHPPSEPRPGARSAENVRRLGSSWAHTASIHRFRVLSGRRSSSTGAHHFDPGIVGKRRSGAEESIAIVPEFATGAGDRRHPAPARRPVPSNRVAQRADNEIYCARVLKVRIHFPPPERDAMGRAARMAISSLTSIDGVPRCLSRTI